MKVPSLEDMIQSQVNGDCICEECHCFLTEHYLIVDPFLLEQQVVNEIVVCCYQDNTDLRFKSLTPKDSNQLELTLLTMLSAQDRQQVVGVHVWASGEIILITRKASKDESP